jgi:hypothetical protein
VSAPRAAPRWAGALVLAALAAMAWHKQRAGILPEMLWACHPAALLVGLGVLLRVPLLTEVGGLFQLGPGLVGYAIELLAMHTTTAPSLLVHVLGPLVALLQMRAGGLRASAKWLAAGYYYVLLALSYLLTPRALNVNVAFAPYAALAPLYGAYPWAHHLTNAVVLFSLLLGADALVRRAKLVPAAA